MLKRFAPKPALVCSPSPPWLASLTSPFSTLVAPVCFAPSLAFMPRGTRSTAWLQPQACPTQTNNPGLDVSWWTAESSLLGW